uniref:Uncharacterized protein n=1 Tax=Chenopodium quinoa TaxID=63459 RepID=A0A803MZL6_CHEQI
MSSVTLGPFSPNNDPRIVNNVDFHLQQAEDCLASASCSVKSSMPLMRSSSSPGLMQIPPPPWRAFQPPGRASTVTRLCKPCDDPFLIAMKECTKSSKRIGFRSLFNIGKITFSCKHGSEVREDGLMRLSQLPSIPRERSTRRSKKS